MRCDFSVSDLDFEKGDGLIPSVIQDVNSGTVLMLGYMNTESFEKTIRTGFVTFYSRSRQSLWVKGETSGNYLRVIQIDKDCDQDALLIQVEAQGPTCHTGNESCFLYTRSENFIDSLERLIRDKAKGSDPHSYTYKLLTGPLNRLIQKVGEEAIELVIEAKDENVDKFCGEGADLIYHLLVLLKAKGLQWKDIIHVLEMRNVSK